MYQQVLDFWFHEIDPKLWWNGGDAFDTEVRTRFMPLLEQAARGELYDWRQTPHGRLAEVIVLDQFSRNIYRGSAAAFACDGMALVLAQEAVAAGVDTVLNGSERVFLYLPYMHSESAVIHRQAEALYREVSAQDSRLQENYRFELRHKAIIDRFGRYPHRNAVLGRVSSAEELEFLKQPGSSF